MAYEFDVAHQLPRELRTRLDEVLNSVRTRILLVYQPASANILAIHGYYNADDENTFTGTITQPDVPRNLSVTFDGAWDGGPVSIFGKNQFNQDIVEVFTPDLGNTVDGEQIFQSVSAIKKTLIGGAHTVGIGIATKLGVVGGGELQDAAFLLYTDDVLDAFDLDLDNSAFTPDTDPNGSHSYKIICNVR